MKHHDAQRFLVAVTLPFSLLSFDRQWSWAQQVGSVNQLIVVDANSKKVGNVLGTEEENRIPIVAFTIGDAVFTLKVFPTAFAGNGGGIYFETTDCSGDPYTEPQGDFVTLPVAVVRTPGNSVYLPSDTEVETVQVRSTLTSFQDNPPNACYEYPVPFAADLLPVTIVANLDLQFAPPFRVEAAPTSTIVPLLP